MPVQLASFLIPKAGNSFFLLEDVYLKGGLRIVPNSAARLALNASTLKPAMLVIDQDTRKIWQLGDDKITWTEFQTGGSSGLGLGQRTTLVMTTDVLPPGMSQDVNTEMAPSNMIYRLSTNVPCKVEAFYTPNRIDSNPYTFVSTQDHLEDDGSYIDPSGSRVFGRRYSVLMNLEDPPTNGIYWRLTNLSQDNAIIECRVSFVPMEV